jgi:hypothetical protein
MGDEPVDLDGRRSPKERLETVFRRGAQQVGPDDCTGHAALEPVLRGQLLAGPADSLADLRAKVEYLLARFALTEDGQDEHIRKLTQRTLSDIARLAKREERKR